MGHHFSSLRSLLTRKSASIEKKQNRLYLDLGLETSWYVAPHTERRRRELLLHVDQKSVEWNKAWMLMADTRCGSEEVLQEYFKQLEADSTSLEKLASNQCLRTAILENFVSPPYSSDSESDIDNLYSPTSPAYNPLSP